MGFQFPLKLRRAVGRDVDGVQRENDALTRKTHMQEEEFKLQNETMKRELDEVNSFFLFDQFKLKPRKF